MMERQKRVAAIHDVSCFGRCSLTVALPILSATGIECAIVPTAVLSTHTGGFTGYTFRDLTDDLTPIADHWKSLNLEFDAVYTGYLGSPRQVDIVCGMLDRIADKNTLVYVDPAMADGGKLYPGFPEDFPKAMLTLCKRADVLIPNITEAVLLSRAAGIEVDYNDGVLTEDYVHELIGALVKATGVKNVILTGISFEAAKLGAAVYSDGKFEYCFSNKIDGYYHGTGDIFGSVALAAILSGKSYLEASQLAATFVTGCIKRTVAAGTDLRFGVNFEAGLAELGTYLQK